MQPIILNCILGFLEVAVQCHVGIALPLIFFLSIIHNGIKEITTNYIAALEVVGLLDEALRQDEDE